MGMLSPEAAGDAVESVSAKERTVRHEWGAGELYVGVLLSRFPPSPVPGACVPIGPICNLPEGMRFRTLKAMNVDLTPDQKAFARRAIESGRLQSEQDAVQEALALWEERERQRTEFLLTLDDAKASLARGEGLVITQQSMQQLAQEVKERGRARLLAELTTTPR